MIAWGQPLTFRWIWVVDFQLQLEMTPPWELELPLTPHRYFIQMEEQLLHAYCEPGGQVQAGCFDKEP